MPDALSRNIRCDIVPIGDPRNVLVLPIDHPCEHCLVRKQLKFEQKHVPEDAVRGMCQGHLERLWQAHRYSASGAPGPSHCPYNAAAAPGTYLLSTLPCRHSKGLRWKSVVAAKAKHRARRTQR